MILEIDVIIRRFLSIIFRVLLLVYSLTILLRFNNVFEWYYYLIAIFVYIFNYNLCFGREGKYGLRPFLRLLNDYTLFFIVLYGKPINDPHAMILLLLPVINALNHSSEKKSRTHSVPMYVLVLLSIYLLDNFQISIGIIVSIFSLGMINLFLSLRVTLLNYSDKLNSILEDYNVGFDGIRKHHRLLKSLLSKFDDFPSPLKSILFSPQTLLCFRVVKNRMVLKSSSKFYLQAEIQNEEKLLASLKVDNIIFNNEIALDGIIKKFNSFIQIEVNNKKYIFLFIFDKSENSRYSYFFIKKFLLGPLIKVARIIDYENKLKGQRRKVLEQYKSKFKMLEDTRDTLHLVKNKLTPIYNYFELLERGEKNGNDYSEQLIKSRERIKPNLKIIKEKSTPYLINQMNPYGLNSEQIISLKKLYNIVINSFQEEMTKTFNLSFGSIEGLNREVTFENLEMLDFLLSEIVMNSDEHSIDNSIELYFSFEKEELILHISNKIKLANKKEMIIKSFNREDISLTLEKHFNGLTLVKRYLLKLNIGHSITINDDIFKLKLNFKTNESTNI